MVFTGDLLFNGGTPFALMGSISHDPDDVLLMQAPDPGGASLP